MPTIGGKWAFRTIFAQRTVCFARVIAAVALPIRLTADLSALADEVANAIVEALAVEDR